MHVDPDPVLWRVEFEVYEGGAAKLLSETRETVMTREIVMTVVTSLLGTRRPVAK